MNPKIIHKEREHMKKNIVIYLMKNLKDEEDLRHKRMTILFKVSSLKCL